MSLELTLVPLSLVLINVIDKKYYESWIKNRRIKKETSYECMEDFLYALNKTGYVYDVKQDIVRIHGEKEGVRYYFSNLNGKWILSFNEYDSEREIKKFIEKVAAVSNGHINDDMPVYPKKSQKQIAINSVINKVPPLERKKINFYPTMYNDTNLLKDALKRLGVIYSTKGETIEYVKDSIKCTFMKDTKGRYLLRTVGDISEEDLYRDLQDIDFLYRENVQKMTYETVLSELEEYNMSLASEERLEDDTIVLTLNVE